MLYSAQGETSCKKD